ncbi:MAG TPA: MarR family winged helix-turn-helix transcriptional regulator [Candidatus Limnocylindrales bacterium]
MTASINPGIIATPRPGDLRGAPSGGAAVDRAALARAIVADYQSYIRHFRCASAERLGKQGVSMAHLHVLWLLLEHGDLPMGRLAELLDVSLSNATGLVDRMEERTLVERVRVRDDRRLVLVRPTTQGLEAVEAMEVFRRDLFEQVLERLDIEQLQRLHQSVLDLRAAMPEPAVCGPATSVPTAPTE